MHHQPVRTIAALTLVTASGFFAPAAHAADGVLAACIGKATGTMRLADPGGACRNGESPVTWNVQGPQGAQGPQGPQGPAGPQTLINAVVNSDGSLVASGVPANATLTVTRVGPGSFTVLVTGLGTTCPLPMAMPYGTDAIMSMGGGYCVGGELSINIFNAKGTDTGFVLLVTALSPTQNAAAAARRSAVKRFDPR